MMDHHHHQHRRPPGGITQQQLQSLDQRESTTTFRTNRGVKTSPDLPEQQQQQNQQSMRAAAATGWTAAAVGGGRSVSPISSMEASCSEQESNSLVESDPVGNLRVEEMRYADARMGVCSVCHCSVTGDDAQPDELEKALLCADGHLLCCRCVQRYDIKSETSCVLCATIESQESTNSSRSESSSSNNKQINESRLKRRNRRLEVPNESCQQLHQQVPTSSGGGGGGGGGVTESRARLMASRCGDASYIRLDHLCDDDVEEEQEEDEEDDYYDEECQEWPSGRKQTGCKQRSYCSIVQKEPTTYSQVIECSRRPIQCPRQDCGLNVAFSALASHFVFDHPEVPVLSVEPGELSSFIVDFEGLVYDSSRCLALLLVSNKLSGPTNRQFGGSLSTQPIYRNRLPLPILAARLRCAAASKEPTGETGRECSSDVLIAWVAGLDVGNFSIGALCCSIQAIDSIGSEAFRSLTYTGPVNSLRTAQKPRDVFLNGDCVILHNGFIHNVTSAHKNININVTIH